jgi:hypothetical protein
MMNYNGYGGTKWGVPLLLMSIALVVSQILSTAWCSANSEIYGYFQQGTFWQSCVYEMPGSWFFRTGSVALSSMSVSLFFMEGFKSFQNWRVHKQVNLSRTTLIFSLFAINALLETLSRAHSRPDDYESFFSFIFDNFFYLFGAAVLLLAVSLWSIHYKVELIFSLSRRNR